MLQWFAGTSQVANSLRVWLILLGFIGLVNLFITFVGAGLQDDPRVVLFSWPAIAIFGVLGCAGIALSHRTGFPAAWDERVSNRQRFLVPALLGTMLGVLESGLDRIFHWTAYAAQGMGMAFNAPLPGSPLFYTAGAIEVEVLYRLLPVPLLLWLISNVLLRGRGQTPIFWTLAVLSSLLEPADQDLRELNHGASLAMVGSAFVPDLLLNLAQVVMFRRYGFLAAIATRVAFYVVWHVVYGNLICAC